MCINEYDVCCIHCRTLYFVNCNTKGGDLKKMLIELPLFWTELVEETSISAHLTPIGAHQDIIVKRIGQNRIWLQAKGGMPIDCYYFVIGERRDIPRLIPS